MYIRDTLKNQLVAAEIMPVDLKNTPSKKDGWKFDWSELATEHKEQIFVLRTLQSPENPEGALHLLVAGDMLVMNALELAPTHVGTKHTCYDDVAGCLIAFACRESFKVKSNYRGFLTFVAKSKLIYCKTDVYGAKRVLGQRMCIDWETGQDLIKKYLQQTKMHCNGRTKHP